MKRNILKERRRLKGSMIKESWRRKNEEKEVKKNLTTLTSFTCSGELPSAFCA